VCISVYLAQLEEKNLESHSYRFAKGTAQNMLSGIRTWFMYCVYFNQPILPATSSSVIPFLELMSLTATYLHLKHLISAVKFYHLARGVSFPEHDFDIENTLHGLKRKLSHTPHQALPLTPGILRDLFNKLDMSNAKDRALWCSYLVTFYCLFSNSVPKSAKNIDPRRTLLRRHVHVDTSRNMVYVHVTFAKTIQFGIETWSYLSPAILTLHLTQSDTCMNCSPKFRVHLMHQPSPMHLASSSHTAPLQPV
jgi:hypothetical protein